MTDGPVPDPVSDQPLLTVGHGTATADELGDRLRTAGVVSLVDIRIGPGSRRQPHVNRTALAEWLPSYGVRYRWEQRLGGFRPLPADSPDTALRNASFRGYAAWMRTPDFLTAVSELLAAAATDSTAVMCSESVWWRCHRRLVADFVQLARGVAVEHLMPHGRRTRHPPTDGVRLRSDGLLVYDVDGLPAQVEATGRTAGGDAYSGLRAEIESQRVEARQCRSTSER